MSEGEPAGGVVRYFHQADDPYSHLAVQLLPRLAAAYDVAVEVFLVPAPAESAAPDRERLAGWSLRDAARLASAHHLSLPANARQPGAEQTAIAQQALAAALGQPDFAARAVAIGEALWRGDDRALERLPLSPSPDVLAAGEARRLELGHYLGATFHHGEMWFWGPDRLHYLEDQLAAHRRPGAAPVAQAMQEGAAPELRSPVTLDFFASFRSPYTWLAARRVRELARRHGATLRLRPVLPMVMRGLPVPREKQVYIVRDCWREALRQGIAFGRMVDPVGLGVERGMGVLGRAMALGKGMAFAESFLGGAFSEAIDATTDDGLWAMAQRAGLTKDDVAAGLADESWRDMAEANRREMLDLGLWGVPSFRVGALPGHWGQDRLWAVEQDLISLAKEAAA
ncbi:MAG: 2-hydroxychromene-2-carboxylate isomerase [Caulobacter sp.]|nr:2-hydroxychromene-2-carboxylate isomerase [Caulobacter sp.]